VFTVEIYTPEKRVFQGEAKYLIAPGKKGWFGILTNHAPLLSSLCPGRICVDMMDNTRKTLKVPGGFLEVDNNRVIILADAIDHDDAAVPPAPHK